MSNRQRLSREIGDLAEIIAFAINAGLVDANEIDLGMRSKRKQLDKFLQTQPD